MGFRTFLNEEASLEQLMWPWITKVKSYVMNGLRADQSTLSLSFPKNYSILFSDLNSNSDVATTSMRLVAHVVYEGVANEHPYGKGGLAVKSLGSGFSDTLNARQSVNFQRSFSSSIKNIASEMGEIFELELFLFFVEKGLNAEGFTRSDAINKIQELMTNITRKTTSSVLQNNINQFISKHADSMGESIFQKTTSLLKCKADTVKFTGGSGASGFSNTYRKTADLVLSCSTADGRSELGWSSKFTSETMITIGRFFTSQIYKMLGGKDKEFEDIIKTSDQEYVRNYTLTTIESLLRDMSQDEIESLINKTMFGSTADKSGVGDTLLAFRNYVRNKGDADWSGGLKLDFNMASRKGKKLSLKTDSKIQINRTKLYVSLNIKVPDGSWNGTTIKFEPTKDNSVNIKMNNLTSTGRNN